MFEFGLEFSMYLTGEWAKDLLINLILFPLGGGGFGWWMWKIEENNKDSLDVR
nr:hypothetical protein [Anaerobacillus isosaccharinicus]MBA5587205.1 hypothetical protein [Anaerobacillus isosaccharinicus]QOY34600.1 hypothetical protein AWH56_017980 [Anaerobacillus isosaccharinicus]